MKKLLALAFVAALAANTVFAVDACAPCPPQYKWIEVCETIQVPVTVTEYVDEPCEISVTRMVPTEKVVPTVERQWVTETKMVPYTERVWETEEYTGTEIRTETRTEKRVKNVWKTVTDTEEKLVTRKVCEEVCDPVTGKITKVWKTVCETVQVPVKRKVCEEVEYTVKIPCKVPVPVTKTRKVCRTVQKEREVLVRKCIEVPGTKTVVVMNRVVEKQTVMRKKAVCTTKMVDKQVVKKVKVPVEPPC